MPPPKPTVFCKAFPNVCKHCGRRFLKRERKINPCPSCGTDRTCGMPAVKGFTSCQNHGGPNPYRGVWGSEKDMSRFEIVQVSRKYNQMRTDGRILSNRAALEVVRMRIAQLAERIDLNDAPERLKNLQTLWEEYREMLDRGKDAEATVIMYKIDEEFERAYHDYAAWRQIFEAIDMDRKLVESELKVVKEMRAIMTAEDAHELVAKLLGVITDVVTDPKQLREIQYKFVRLIGEQPVEMPRQDVSNLAEEEHEA